jgi:hypothetical protein
MIRLHLTQQEQAVLIEVLESFLSELRMEIADTERKSMRDVLKNQEVVIKRVLESLRTATDEG